MKLFPIGLIILLLIAGCAWNPTRDNPVDPKSTSYVPPAQPNRPPVIDTIIVVTDCHGSNFAYYCSFSIICRIHDLDQNLLFDSVFADIQTDSMPYIELGRLSYDVTQDAFVGVYGQNEFPDHDFSDLRNDPVRVWAYDDSTATVSRSIGFPTPQTRWPSLVHPKDNAEVNDVHPQLGWYPWNPSTNDYTYDVKVYYQGWSLVWDTTGLPASDTSVVVSASLVSADVISEIYHVWQLTVNDRDGNRITAIPAVFQVIVPRQPIKMEPTAVASDLQQTVEVKR
jgi:hypothetical protein